MFVDRNRAMLRIYQDLAIPTRRAMLGALLSGPKNVSEVVAVTGLKQPNVSNHFAKMRQSKTVRSSRIGREIYYAFASPDVEDAVRAAVEGTSPLSADLDLGTAANDYAQHAIEGREQECGEIVNAVIRAGTPLIDIYEDLIAKSMHIVGSMYDRGLIDEAHEHAASAITELMLARISASQLPHRPTGTTALIGCAANNWHAIGARLLSDFLKHQGLRVVYLGPNVPTDAFLRAITSHQPDAVLVSVSTASIPDARELLMAMRNRFPDLPTAVGGSGAHAEPDRLANLGVAFPGPSLRSVAAWLTPAHV